MRDFQPDAHIHFDDCFGDASDAALPVGVVDQRVLEALATMVEEGQGGWGYYSYEIAEEADLTLEVTKVSLRRLREQGTIVLRPLVQDGTWCAAGSGYSLPEK